MLKMSRWVADAPDRIVLTFFWLCLVVSVTVLLGWFHPAVVLPASALVIAATWKLMPARPQALVSQAALTEKAVVEGTASQEAVAQETEPGRHRAYVWGAASALLYVLAWLVANIPFASRFVMVNRDPGFLTLAGFWLRDNPGALVPLGYSAQVAAAVPGFTAVGRGYYLAGSGDALYTQGANLLPGLLGMMGWAGGDMAIMAGNLIMGAISLLAVYGFARRVTGPLVALVPLVALSLGAPMLVFSRAAYSEIVTIALVFGGLTVGWAALTSRKHRLMMLSGAMVGAAGLARIDGAAGVAGLVLALGLAAALAVHPDRRRFYLLSLAWGTVGAIAVLTLGWLDLRLLSPVYLDDLGPQFALLNMALAASLALAAAINIPWVSRWAGRLVSKFRRPVAVAVTVATLALGLALLSRPLWYVGHHQRLGTPFADLVQVLQAQEGIYPIDGTRSYDEQTLTWISWYQGWIFVALALLGIAVAAWKMSRRSDSRFVFLLAVVAGPSLLYLWRASITPDQIWAMRRLISVTVPGFAVLAALVLKSLWESRREWIRQCASLLAVGVLAYPLHVSTVATGWFTQVEHEGMYGIAHRQCQLLEGRPTVLVGNSGMHGTLQILCGAQVIRPINASFVTSENLAQVRQVWGQDVVVLTDSPHLLTWATGQEPPPLIEAVSTRLALSLTRRPQGIEAFPNIWRAGLICPDGSISDSPTSDAACHE